MVFQYYTQGSMIVGKHWSKSLHASPLKNKETFCLRVCYKEKKTFIYMLIYIEHIYILTYYIRTALFSFFSLISLTVILVSFEKASLTPLLFPHNGDYFLNRQSMITLKKSFSLNDKIRPGSSCFIDNRQLPTSLQKACSSALCPFYKHSTKISLQFHRPA